MSVIIGTSSSSSYDESAGPVAPAMMIHTIVGEIQTVVATMRNNKRFSAFSHSNPLLRDFKSLRSHFSTITKPSEVDMCKTLKPFLAVIRSEETSGPITGVALISVYKFIVYGFIDVDKENAAKAIAHIADTVTHCRFEVTNPDVDDVVLMKILRVLLACLCCPAGVLLTDDLVCEMVQTCYRMTTQSRICELLRKTAEHAIMEIVHVLFLIDGRHSHRELRASSCDVMASVNSPISTAYVNPRGVRFHKTGDEVKDSFETKPYGKGALVRVFAFLCSLINPHDERHTESINVLGLQLLISIVEAQADLIQNVPAILSLVVDELSRFLLQSLTTHSLDVLNLVMRLFFNLYVALRPHLKVQIEVFFTNLLSQILENEELSFETREVAMEHLVQFVCLPQFISDIYINYDCHEQCSDLFINLTKFLCKSSFPVEGVLYSTQLQSLEALLSILHSFAERRTAAKAVEAGGPGVSGASLRAGRERKALLLQAAEVFNESSKKGLAFLKEKEIIPNTEETDATALAAFLKTCPGLKKDVVGEYISAAKHSATLDAYLQTFDFTDVPLIASIRQFLTAFFFKGEGQALERILDSFSQRWVTNNPGDTFIISADMACVLSYSIVILNVDAHNAQIKEKMTATQYVKMWGHANEETSTVPDVLLHEYYNDITQNEIKIHDDSPAGEVTSVRWPALLRSMARKGAFITATSAEIDRDMFKIIGKWIVASLSAVWDNLNEAGLQLLLVGFENCAAIAASHNLSDLFDTTVTHLCKFTTLLSPPSSPVKRSRVNFGTNWRAQLATATVFSIASKHGGHFREAWRYVLRCITSLHTMGLAEDLIDDHDTFDALKSKGPQAKKTETGSSSSMFSLFTGGWFSSEVVVETNPEDEDAEATAKKCVDACGIKGILEGTRSLQADSLVYLIKALRRESTKSKNNKDFDEKVACFCLDLLTNITLGNVHRISFVWVLVYEHFTGLVQMAKKPQPLVEKAITSLLLLCVHLVHKEEIRGGVLSSLELILQLNAAVSTAMAESIAVACTKLIQNNPEVLSVSIPTTTPAIGAGGPNDPAARPEAAANAAETNGWNVILGILDNCAIHPMAHVRGLMAIQALISSEANARLVFLPAHFPVFLRTVQTYIARSPAIQQPGGPKQVSYTTSSPLLARSAETLPSVSGHSPLSSSSGSTGSGGVKPLACRTVDVLYFLFDNSDRAPTPPPTPLQLWSHYRLPVMRAVCVCCTDVRNDVRNYAMGILQRTLVSPYTSQLHLDGLRDCFTQVLFPLLQGLLRPFQAQLAAPGSPATFRKPRTQDSQDETRVRAITLLSKFLLQNLTQVTQLADFHTKVWPEILDMIALYTTADQSGLLAETIPETLKNMLLIMFQSGAFQCTHTIGGVDVWTYTWTKIHAFCPVLQGDESFKASLRTFQSPNAGGGHPIVPQTALQSPQPARRPREAPLPSVSSPLAAPPLLSSDVNGVLFQDIVVGPAAPGSPTAV